MTEPDVLPANRSTAANISLFVQNFSIETTPRGALKIDRFADHLEPGTRVYVTSLPGSAFEDSIATCVRLAREGLVPVPHFTARSFADRRQLAEAIARVVNDAGVKQVLALAGADRRPAGAFVDSISMLETGLFDKYGIQSVGIAGHPEGSPDIPRDALREHGYRKIRFAELTDTSLYLVTQFAFDSRPILDWVARIRREGNPLPVVVGIPGIASLKSLIGHAKACGVGESIAVLLKRAGDVRKLLSLQEPNELIRSLAEHVACTPHCGIDGIHVYPLGGFTRSADWARAVAVGRIRLTEGAFSLER